MMKIVPVTLTGASVRLSPLSLDHLDQLCAIGLAEELWKVTMTRIRTRAEMEEYIATALRWQNEGTALPFVIIELSSNTAVGSTRYANVDTVNRRLEIGWTWIARPWQRTAVNTEAKYLLLEHAFETLGCLRVEFKTDSLNQQSRNAILRIGAKEEGMLRNHMITPSGRYRHSVYYSIIDEEWAGVKKDLQAKIRR